MKRDKFHLRGKKNPAITGINIGHLIAEKIQEQRLSKSELSRRINRPPSAIRPLLKRPSMQAYLLWELSLAMNYNFFHHLSEQLLTTAGEKMTVAPESDKATIASLQQEVKRLTEERDYLKKMIDIMAKGN